MSHPSWYEENLCCEHEGTQHCNCRAYYPARKPMKKQVGDSLFRGDNDMLIDSFIFGTELGEFEIFPVCGKWSYAPTFANGGDNWSVRDTGLFSTAIEALQNAVRWAQENYDGSIPEGIERVAPHWDRVGKKFYPGGWTDDQNLFHTLEEVYEQQSLS